MADQSEYLQNSLKSLEKIVHQSIAQNAMGADVIELENWLVVQLDKIRVSKLDAEGDNVIYDLIESRRQDSIWIFNNEFEILHYAGMHGQIGQNPEYVVSRLMIEDLLGEKDFQLFKTAFHEAYEGNKNESVSVSLCSGMGNIQNCKITIDMSMSNKANNRFMACLSCPENPLLQMAEYQSIIFENMPDIDIYLFDKEYRYLFCAGGEKRRFNFSNVGFVGKTIFEAYDKKTVRSIYPFYNKVLNGEKTEGEVRYQSEIYYILGTPLKDAMGKTVAGILFAQNVTKDKEVEEQLRKSKEEAQKANQAKSIFIANMSHEIRTPLNAIIGFTEQLSKTELSDEQQKFVKLVQKASDHLLYLVGEVVFLFKLGMGKVYLEKVPFNPQGIMNELGAIFTKQARENNLSFSMEGAETLPVALSGDPYRLRQILMNLLVNAMKYTDAGSVTFRCMVRKNQKKKVLLRFEVQDTGVGIPPENKEEIFNVFEQGAVSTPGRQTGAGLGLGICKRLVELLDGEIRLKSKPGVGSTFTVDIPYQRASEDSLTEDNTKQFVIEKAHLEGIRILVADDDDHNLMLAKMILQNWGVELTTAKDGAEAMEFMSEQTFDVVLLDIHMPKKTGLELIKLIRRDPKGPNFKTLILAVTANALKNDLTKYLKAGFDDYLIKPYREQELYNKICSVLGFEPDNVMAEESAEFEPFVEQEEEFSFDISELEAAANGDQEFFAMMIQNFLNNLNTLLERLASDLKTENFEGVGEAAHKALSSFKFFKLEAFVSSLQELEDLALRNKQYEAIPEIVEQLSDKLDDLKQHIQHKYLQN